MAYVLVVWYPPYLGLFSCLSWMVQPSMAIIILSISLCIVLRAVGREISSVACLSAGVSLLETGQRFTTTGINGSGTPTGNNSGEIAGAVPAAAE